MLAEAYLKYIWSEISQPRSIFRCIIKAVPNNLNLVSNLCSMFGASQIILQRDFETRTLFSDESASGG